MKKRGVVLMNNGKTKTIGDNYFIKYFFIIVLISFLVSIAYIIFQFRYPPENLVTQSVPIIGFVFAFALWILPILSIVIVTSELVSVYILKITHSKNLFSELILRTFFGTLIGFLLLHFLLKFAFSLNEAPFNPEFWFPFFSSMFASICLLIIKKKSSKSK